jgi:predicted PurR-regulated permease PerM
MRSYLLMGTVQMNITFGTVGVLAICTLFCWICLPFLSPFIWALVIYQVLAPLHRKFSTRLSRTGAAATMVVIVGLAGVVPLTLIGGQLAYEATSTIQSFQGKSFSKLSVASIQKKLDSLPLPAPLKRIAGRYQIDEEALAEHAASAGQKLLQFIAVTATNVAILAGTFIFDVVFFLVLFFFLCRDGKEWRQRLIDVVPPRYCLESLLERLAAGAAEVFCGVAGTCLLQGLLGGIAFAALGLPLPFLAGAVMTFCALIPAVGTALVWGPAALWLLLTGSVTKGIILIAIGAGVIGMIDNVTRPVLIRLVGSKLTILTITMGAIGGIAAFGLTGLIIGPLAIEAFSWLLQFLAEKKESVV